MGKNYRPCVVAVFINESGKVLVGLRSDLDVWQFPQGGVEPGEDSIDALYREVEEELGCRNFQVIKTLLKEASYDFPEELKTPISKHYKGQKQDWFLCEFDPGCNPNLEKATTDEFRQLKWVDREEILHQTVWWKKDVYKSALSQI